MKTLSLVVPVYNAPDLAKALLTHVAELAASAESSGFRLVETILVDDGSESPLADAIREAGPGLPPLVILRNEPNLGKGASVRRGALAAKGDWVLMSDVDLSAPLGEFSKLAAYPEAWMVCGSRYGRPGMPLRRRILSCVFHLLVEMAGVKNVCDTQCGFKLFRMNVMRKPFEALRTERFAFDVELILGVQRAGGEIKEIPVEWFGGKRSSLRVFKDAPRMLIDVLRIRHRASGTN